MTVVARFLPAVTTETAAEATAAIVLALGLAVAAWRFELSVDRALDMASGALREA